MPYLRIVTCITRIRVEGVDGDDEATKHSRCGSKIQWSENKRVLSECREEKKA